MSVVLVTGGAGFIGAHLTMALLARGDQVICLDSFYTGTSRNIAEHLTNPMFSLIQGDVRNEQLEALQVDLIFNLACPASPRHYQRDPIFTFETSVLGTLNLLRLATRCSAPMIHASTSEVYGDPDRHPQTENYWGNVNPIGIRACYDEGKRAAETICTDYGRTGQADVRIARIFNTYGPKMALDDGRVVSNFIMQALKGEPLTIYGDGTQTRSLCYVSDLVEGLLALAGLDKAPDGPVNLGNPVEYRIDELALEVLRLCQSSSNLVYKPLPQDDPRRRRPDISLASAVLNWKPQVPLNQGLEYMIEEFKGRL